VEWRGGGKEGEGVGRGAIELVSTSLSSDGERIIWEKELLRHLPHWHSMVGWSENMRGGRREGKKRGGGRGKGVGWV